jgi:hypothetical protein
MPVKKPSSNPWDELSMSHKRQLMGYYLDNGYTEIDKMKQHYNDFTASEQRKQTLSYKPADNHYAQQDNTRVATVDTDQKPMQVQKKQAQQHAAAVQAHQQQQGTLRQDYGNRTEVMQSAMKRGST